MKKIVSFIIILAAFVSCQSDVEFNNPAFQAQKDNYQWKADYTEATIADGYLTINAFSGAEVVTLVVPAPQSSIASSSPVTYYFGSQGDEATSDDIIAAYTFSSTQLGFEYSTGKNIGNGKFIIESYNMVSKKLTGKFNFNAKYQGEDTTIPENVNFQSGVIYKIQVK